MSQRALAENEIWDFVKDYATAAKNAIDAGFDGVEIHGANGFLVDQFLQDMCNKRTDAWGGSVARRARFALEVTKAVVEAIGANKTAMRLSPWNTYQGMGMVDPMPQFAFVVQELKKLKLAYLHLVESRVQSNEDAESTGTNDFLIDIWTESPLLLAGGFNAESAKTCVDEQYRHGDIAIVFGRYFTRNPDLPFRIQKGIEFEPYNRNTFYNAKSPDGYIDYQFSKQFIHENHQFRSAKI
ncbi:FMN-linked oxidoreductase [Hyaloscypha variabilis F]|uniref:FMN-linked oxidoreductase n=1 Tax=Hyaloscypha variabilis (strain UAMH 11265 / GT02V1 / F) TaxID=1149755 RepID=A0A2J6R6Z4_HYAVF|nr:FMN-linked oxidoreductase [Hyaloscypha variabilis F]